MARRAKQPGPAIAPAERPQPSTAAEKRPVAPQPAETARPPWMAPAMASLAALPAMLSALGAGVYVGNGTDLYSYQVALRAAAGAALRAGEFPLWNPQLLGGVPALAGWQLGLLYPPNVAAAVLSPAAGTEWLLWLHVAWLAAGGAVLAQNWQPQAGWMVAALAGAWLALTGPTWGHVWAGHVSFIEAWAWWPWLWAALVAALDRRSLRHVGFAAGALGLQLLCGHPQVVFLCLAGAVLVLAARAAVPLDPPQQNPKSAQMANWPASAFALVILMATVAAAALLTLPQWLATAELAPALNRKLSTPLEIATAYSAPAQTLWTAIDAGHFGGPRGPKMDFSYHETVAFVGPAMLALAALAAWRRPRVAVPLLLGGAVCVELSLGSFGSLLPALADSVPGLGSFRVPARWLLVPVAVLPLAVLPLAARREGWPRPAVLAGLALAVVHGLAFAASHWGADSRKPADSLLWPRELAAVLAEKVGEHGRLATAPGLRQANWGGAAGVRVAGGYEPAITAETNYYGNLLAGRSAEGYAVMFQSRRPTPWLQRMAVSHVLVGASDAATAQQFSGWAEAAVAGPMRVLANPAPMPRAQLLFRTALQPDAAKAATLLADLPPDTVTVDAELPADPKGTGQVQWQTDGRHEVRLRTQASGAGVLVLRDAWAPGWRAEIDGQPAKTAKADAMFRAVAVPAGDHEVVWRYQPAGWPWALAAAAAGWAALAAWLWRSRRPAA